MPQKERKPTGIFQKKCDAQKNNTNYDSTNITSCVKQLDEIHPDIKFPIIILENCIKMDPDVNIPKDRCLNVASGEPKP